MPRLSVGQTLYFVPHRGAPREVTITSVGRKWAYFGRHDQIRMETMAVQWDGFDHGRVYLSEADYEAERAADNIWAALYRKILPRSRPPGITADAIRQAAALLGIELSEAGNG